MFGFETNQQQINNLNKRFTSLSKAVYGGMFGNGLEDSVSYLKEHVKAQENAHEDLRKRVAVLEEIVRESGLITDFNEDEVKIREDRKRDLFGTIVNKHVPYQINKVKVI